MGFLRRMEDLIEGYRRYRANRWPELRSLHRYLADRGQNPRTLVIACSDSRVDPATIFDAGPGELFVIRNVANLAPPCEDARVGHHGTSAAIEFAVSRLKVETIMVLGHAQCGGVAHALATDDRDTGSFLDAWVHLLDPAIARLNAHEADPQSALEHESIRVTLENLLTFPFVNDAVRERGLKLIGARYGVADGVLELLDPETGAFAPAI
ncbi:MAG: carbonic anhydrase [Pseudomonadota bacterium]